MSAEQPTIIYTLTDEAPLLATYAFLPIIRTFTEPAGINVEDQRHLGGGAHPGRIRRLPDRRAARAGQPGRAGQADAAAGHQHHQAAEHQRLGAAAAWPPSRNCRTRATRSRTIPATRRPTRRRRSRQRYGKCLGSAVNPVLREGNSDRRAPKAVKEYARKHPHCMGEWSQASRTHVATHAARRLLPRREVDDAGPGAQREDGADHQERQDHRAQARGHAGRRRRHRQHVHEQEGPVRVLRGARSRTRTRPA